MSRFRRIEGSFFGDVERNRKWGSVYLAQHPKLGNDGEFLNLDVIGRNVDAPNALVVISGTHGIEGLPGILTQQRLVNSMAIDLLPEDVAVLLIPTLNPWGTSHGERTDHENIDVNRGCGDEAPPVNDGYLKYQGIVEPKTLDEKWLAEVRSILENPVRARELMVAVLPGQNFAPKGLFFGSFPRSDCWSKQQIQKICAEVLVRYKKVAVIDLHTGLGPYAKGGLISPLANRAEHSASRTIQWLGYTVQFPNARGASVAQGVHGDVLNCMIRNLPNSEVTAIALEVGTTSFAESFPALIARNWYRHHPQACADRQTLEFNAIWEKTFAPIYDGFWLGAMWSSFRDLFDQMVVGLAS